MSTTTTILIVDDEPSLRFALQEILTRDGHRVVAVESGAAALERVAVEEFDLALIDLKMKGMGGMEVLASLRRQAPDTAVIVLTAHGSLETAVEALRQGAHDYLFKPCKTVEIRESVRMGLLKRQRALRQRELLAQLEHSLSSQLEGIRTALVEHPVMPPAPLPEPATEQSRFLQRNGLIVDSMRHVITLDGYLLELSPTEFDLLAYLVSEAPRVISPQELVREVRGYESELWEARDTVRYHIYHIRQKVKATTERTDIIRTVRGVGYTINET
ncbi:MAG: response regulator transcription factor [Anaerolineae bacterium]|nr:response regulator transcription factor [Anaerolineae bacterium]